MATRKKKRKRVKRLSNVPRDAVEVYPRLKAIEAEKPDGQLYRHDFTSKTPVLGLEDGSLLIPAGSRPLWRMFG